MSERIVNPRPASTLLAGWIRTCAPRIIAGLALGVVASVAGVISYTHIDALTLRLGGSQLAGHLMPFGVDGQMVTGSVVLMTATGATARWGWLGIGLGMLESLAANWEAGIAHGPLAATWSAVPALSFAVASFTFERWLKAQVGQGGPAGRTGPAEQAGEPAAAPGPAVEYVTVEVPVEVPVSCGHEFPADADQAVISAWLHSRECDGEELSQRQLADRFGQSRQRVAALVREYLDEAAREARELAAGEGGRATAEPEAASA